MRFQVWVDPFKDAQGQGYQIVQSLFSLADGGLVGVGIGNGMANNIPVVESDFIFSAIGEEMGLLGGGAVLIQFMLFAVRGLTTAARAKSDLAAFSATGLTAAISFQAFLIVGGVTRLLPLPGVTLPFMSQGGSSLLASFIIVALLLRAGDEATGREAELTGTGTMAAITDDQVASAAAPTGTRFATSSSYGSGSHSGGSRMRRRLLDTPESGVLGRVALANRLTRAVLAFTALFAILIGNLTYVQVIKAKDYQDMPTNNHTIARSKYIQRGSIITSDGVTLAESLQQEDGTYERGYPAGNLATHVVGYASTQFMHTLWLMTAIMSACFTTIAVISITPKDRPEFFGTGKPVKVMKFRREMAAQMEALNMDPSYADRYLNVGFSGGEKKKAEILQLLMLKPALALLDETDSGLDVDAVKTVASGIKAYHNADNALIIITHNAKILEGLQVDYVHVLDDARIVRTGDGSLVNEIIEEGFTALKEDEAK